MPTSPDSDFAAVAMVGRGAAIATPAVGRGAAVRPANRHERTHHEQDAGGADEPTPARLPTVLHDDVSRSIVNRNDSPDVPFRWSVNPYRGCEHGCAYCYARPSHELLGFDAGLGFETQIVAKRDAPELLRRWLARPAWRGEPIVFSGVTDCYQPAERELEITRGCLEVAAESGQPVGVITKSALVTRDVDLLTSLARRRAASVAISLTTLDEDLARRMEPRASAPAARLRAIGELAGAGVPVHVMTSPVIPGLNDHELPELLAAAKQAGARSASFTLLRLPGAVADVFFDWLYRAEPLRAPRVERLLRSCREGRANDPRFGSRMTGSGAYAAQIARTHRVFANRLGLDRGQTPLSSDSFHHPGPVRQMRLF